MMAQAALQPEPTNERIDGGTIVSGAAIPGAELLSAFPHAAVVTDLAGVVMAWNPAAEKLYGRLAAEAIGRPSRDLIPGPGTEQEAAQVWAQLRAEGSWSGDFSVRRGDGTVFVAQVVLVPLTSATAEPFGVLGLSEDVTVRRAQERTLNDERDRLALALAAGGLGLWTWDRSSRLVSWGDRLADMFGRESGALPETLDSWLEIVHPDDRAEVAAAMARAVDNRGVAQMEYRVVWPDGSVRWLECRGKVTLDGAGTVTGAVGVMADVTCRRAALAESELLRARLELLSTVGRSLIEADGVEGRLGALTKVVVPQLADCCSIHLVGGDRHVRLAATHHRDPQARAAFEQLVEGFPVSIDQRWGAGAVIASGAAQLVGEVTNDVYADMTGDDPGMVAGLESLGLHSILCVPLSTATRTLGALSLGRSRTDPWVEADQTLAVEVGRRAGTLIDNAQLLDAERRARAASDAAQSRETMLAELSMTLSSSLDLGLALDRLATRLVPELADICIVDLSDELMGDRLAAVAARTVEAKELFEEAERRLPRRRNPTSSLTRTLRSGQPTLIADCDDTYLSVNTPDASVAALYHQLRLSSILVVPLVARGRTFGAITLLRSRMSAGPERPSERGNGPERPSERGNGPSRRGGSDDRYTSADQELASEIGRRSALAIDNARLYTAEHQVAEQLQRSLLPEISPRPHMAAAARYLPASAGVGGDWYDLFEIPDGATGIAIGDVMGHDMQAAASMGQLRSVFRSYAAEGADPADVLDRADRLVQTFGMAQLATAFVAQLTRLNDEFWQVCYANAGHPAPLARHPDGTVTFLDEVNSVLIGARQEGWPDLPLVSPLIGPSLTNRRPHRIVTFPVGTTLLLYTDGLVDRRDRPIDEGMAQLGRLVEGIDGSPEALCDRVARQMADQFRTDDVALLAVTLR